MRMIVKTLSWVMALAMLTLSAWGSSDKAWIGIYSQTVDKDLQSAFELDSDDGVIVKMVVPDSPGDKAGLDEGDIILTVNGEKIVNSEHLSDYVAHLKPGEEVEIGLIRDGNRSKIKLTLGSSSDQDNYFKGFNRPYGSTPKTYSKTYTYQSDNFDRPFLGVSLQDLNDQLGAYFGVKGGQGELITKVLEDSPAEKIGLKAGDVITQINGTSIDNENEVAKMVGQMKEGDEVTITVLREKQEKEFTATLDKAPDGYFGQSQWFGNLPGFDKDFINFPKMRGLSQGNFNFDFFDRDENREQMDNLREEINALKEQLKNIQKRLE